MDRAKRTWSGGISKQTKQKQDINIIPVPLMSTMLQKGFVGRGPRIGSQRARMPNKVHRYPSLLSFPVTMNAPVRPLFGGPHAPQKKQLFSKFQKSPNFPCTNKAPVHIRSKHVKNMLSRPPKNISQRANMTSAKTVKVEPAKSIEIHKQTEITPREHQSELDHIETESKAAKCKPSFKSHENSFKCNSAYAEHLKKLKRKSDITVMTDMEKKPKIGHCNLPRTLRPESEHATQLTPAYELPQPEPSMVNIANTSNSVCNNEKCPDLAATSTVKLSQLKGPSQQQQIALRSDRKKQKKLKSVHSKEFVRNHADKSAIKHPALKGPSQQRTLKSDKKKVLVSGSPHNTIASQGKKAASSLTCVKGEIPVVSLPALMNINAKKVNKPIQHSSAYAKHLKKLKNSRKRAIASTGTDPVKMSDGIALEKSVSGKPDNIGCSQHVVQDEGKHKEKKCNQIAENSGLPVSNETKPTVSYHPKVLQRRGHFTKLPNTGNSEPPTDNSESVRDIPNVSFESHIPPLISTPSNDNVISEPEMLNKAVQSIGSNLITCISSEDRDSHRGENPPSSHVNDVPVSISEDSGWDIHRRVVDVSGDKDEGKLEDEQEFVTIDSTYADDSRDEKSCNRVRKGRRVTVASDFFDDDKDILPLKSNTTHLRGILKNSSRVNSEKANHMQKPRSEKIGLISQKLVNPKIRPDLPVESDTIAVIPSLQRKREDIIANMSIDNAIAAGLQHIHPVSGFHCILCRTFYHDYPTALHHCTQLQHKMKVVKELGVKKELGQKLSRYHGSQTAQINSKPQ